MAHSLSSTFDFSNILDELKSQTILINVDRAIHASPIQLTITKGGWSS
jgi:hypothetical protein